MGAGSGRAAAIPAAGSMSFDGVARSSEIDARCCSAYSADRKAWSGTCTKSGSPRNRLRAANPRRIASASRCSSSTECHGIAARSYLSSMRAHRASTIPPDDGGGMEKT